MEGVESLLIVNEKNSKNHSDEFAVRPGNGSEKLWIVVKGMQSDKGIRGSRLIEGDVMKLGRVLFRVKQLSPDGDSRLTFPSLAASIPVDVYDPDQAGGQPLTCRICLSDAQTNENPLISPCKCSGTMKFIHMECLQEWLKSRLNLKQSGSAMSYFWRTLDCELCKEDFPTTVQVNGTVRDIVEIHKPNCPFLVLEDIRREHSNRGLHVVSMSEGTFFKLGRGHECDIRVSDISVSRLHASIRLQQGAFYLEDKDSKFGTLIQAKRSINLIPGVAVSLQVNRTIVVLKVKQPWGLFQCCKCFQKSARQITEMSAEKAGGDDRESSADDRQGTNLRDNLDPLPLGSTDQIQMREIDEVRPSSNLSPRNYPDAPEEEEKCEHEAVISHPNI